jgi:ribonucleoside-diphosphate reductase alpha chain
MTSKDNLLVRKRNGRGKETLDIEKIHSMVGFATENITGVSASHVEINSGIQFFDGISTEDIQQILIKSANDLISLDAPNYQFVAARLLLFSLRKKLFHKLWEHPTLLEQINSCIKIGVYDKDILNKYTTAEIDRLNGFIDHERDYSFTYAGLRQVMDKYLEEGNLSEQEIKNAIRERTLKSEIVFCRNASDCLISYSSTVIEEMLNYKKASVET